MDLNAKIDALYALPLSEFTAERNALAKSLKGNPAAATIKALVKPSVLAWTVNQLYWHEHALFEQLMSAGRALRASQIARLEGRAADTERAAAEHRAAVTAATAAAQRRATAASLNPPADGLTRMLETLSTAADAPAPPGRLVEAVQPAGFAALLGLAPTAAPRPPAHSRPVEVPGKALPSSADRDARESGLRAAQEQQAAAARAAAELAERTAAQALNDADKAEARAREQVQEARARLEVAEAGLGIATRAAADARRRLDKAQRTLSSLKSTSQPPL